MSEVGAAQTLKPPNLNGEKNGRHADQQGLYGRLSNLRLHFGYPIVSSGREHNYILQ